MATVKNYGLSGIGSDVQLGKKGGRVSFDQTGGGNDGILPAFSFYGADGATLQPVKGGTGLAADEFVTKAQLEAVAAGINVKGAVRTSTNSDLVAGGAVWQGTDGSAGNWQNPTLATDVGQFTNVPAEISGVTLEVGDRVLVRFEGADFTDPANPIIGAGAERNGIYVVTTAGAGGVMKRANDAGGDLALGGADPQAAYDENNNLTGYGDYTFVSDGDNAGDAFLLTNFFGVVEVDPGSEPDLNAADQSGYAVYVTFTQAPVYTADAGIELIGTNFSMDIDGLGDATSALTSTIAFGNGSGGGPDTKQTLESMFQTHNVVYGLRDNTETGTGFIGRSSEDTYNVIEFVPSVAAGEEGVTVSGSIEVDGTLAWGVNIKNRTVGSATDAAELLMYDGTNNTKINMASLISDLDLVRANTAGNGILVKTADNTYANRAIEVNTSAQTGLSIVDGDGINGNPVLGLNIAGMTSAVGGLELTDQIAIYDSSATINAKVTIQDIANVVGAGTDDNRIAQGDSFVEVIDDDVTPGSVTVSVDGNASLVITNGLVQADSLIVDNLGAQEVVLGGGNSNPLNTNSGFTFDGSIVTMPAAQVNGAITATGNIAGAQGNFSSLTVTGGGTFGGNLSAADITGTSLDVGTGTVNGGAFGGTSGSFSGALDADSLTAGAGGITSSDLGVAGGVVFASSGRLEQDLGFSYDTGTNTLTVENLNVTGSGGLTVGQNELAFGDANGNVVSSTSFSVDDATDTLTVGTLAVDGANQSINGTAVDADISIVPDGAGEVIIGSEGAAVVSSDAGQSMTLQGDTDLVLDANTGSVIIQQGGLNVAQFSANANADTHLTVNSDTALNGPVIGTSQDADIRFALGAGKLAKVTDDAAYTTALGESGNSLVNPDALVNKGYVDNLVQTGASEGSVKTYGETVELSINGDTAIGSALPVGAYVMSVRLVVSTPDPTAEVTVGAGSGDDSYMLADENDPSFAGVYHTVVARYEGAPVAITATVSGSAGAGGSAVVLVEYRLPVSGEGGITPTSVQAFGGQRG